MQIIGLSGTNGSGKDTVAEMLAERYGFYFASATDMFREELEHRGLPVDREHKAALSAEWRRQYGMGVIVDRAYEYYQAHQNEYKGMIVGSLRHPGEADRVHELGGQVLWVDADPRVRYVRITANAHARGRAAEDDKTFEEFLAEQEREMHPVGDEATLNIAAVKERADITLLNNGNDIDQFKTQAEATLAPFLNAT
jgi:dephospho-CoA kinase